MLKQFLTSIGLGLSLLCLYGCEPEEDPGTPQYDKVMNITVDNQPFEVRDYLSFNSHRAKGLFNSSISTEFHDAANNNYKVYIDLTRAKFLVPGTYKLPNDTISASIIVQEAASGNYKSWYTGKKAPLGLTITEISPNPMAEKFPNSGQSEMLVFGNFNFKADSVMKGNAATGSKIVSGSFKELLFYLNKNLEPNFNATIDQKPWIGDANTEFATGKSFLMKAYNHWGDVITVSASQTVSAVGTYPVSSATYQKRMPNGTFQTWSLNAAANSGKITIEVSEDRDLYPTNFATGKINFTASPVPNTGSTGNISVNATFKELYLYF